MIPSYGVQYTRLMKKAKPTKRKKVIPVANAVRVPVVLIIPSSLLIHLVFYAPKASDHILKDIPDVYQDF